MWLFDVYNSGDRYCFSVLMSIDLYLCVCGMIFCIDYSYSIQYLLELCRYGLIFVGFLMDIIGRYVLICCEIISFIIFVEYNKMQVI